MSNKTDVFNKLSYKDLFDKINFNDLIDKTTVDIFDGIEVSPEDRILYSEELKKAIRDEITSVISKVPLGKIIKQIIEQEIKKSESKINSLDGKVDEAKVNTEKKINESIGKVEELINCSKFTHYV